MHEGVECRIPQKCSTIDERWTGGGGTRRALAEQVRMWVGPVALVHGSEARD